MDRLPWVTAFVVATVLVPSGTAAQQDPARAGFWWGFGVGYGSWHFEADSARRRSGDDGVTQGYLAAGYTIGPQWTAGVEGALGSIPGSTSHVSSLSLIGTWYPWRAAGWFVRAGLGTSGYRESSGAEAPDYSGSGTGYLVAVGNDLRTTGGVSLTPALTYRYGVVGTVGLGLPVLDLARGFRQRTIVLTLGVTFP